MYEGVSLFGGIKLAILNLMLQFLSNTCFMLTLVSKSTAYGNFSAPNVKSAWFIRITKVSISNAFAYFNILKLAYEQGGR